MVTTEEGRDGEERDVNSFRLQGGITYLPHRRALRNSSDREKPHAETCKPLPDVFPGGSHQLLAGQSRKCAGAGNLHGLQLSGSGSPALPRSYLSHHRTVVPNLSWPNTNAAGSTWQGF